MAHTHVLLLLLSAQVAAEAMRQRAMPAEPVRMGSETYSRGSVTMPVRALTAAVSAFKLARADL